MDSLFKEKIFAAFSYSPDASIALYEELNKQKENEVFNLIFDLHTKSFDKNRIDKIFNHLSDYGSALIVVSSTKNDRDQFFDYLKSSFADCTCIKAFMSKNELLALTSADLSLENETFELAQNLQELVDQDQTELTLFLVDKNQAASSIEFKNKVVFFSVQRRDCFITCTKLFSDTNDHLYCQKKLLSGERVFTDSKVTIQETQSSWIGTPSLQQELINKMKAGEPFIEIFKITKCWVKHLQENLNCDNKLPGTYIDAIWNNTFILDTGLEFVDQEWIWEQSLPLPVLLIRAIHVFLTRVEGVNELKALLPSNSNKKLIKLVAHELGYELKEQDFKDFTELESEFQASVKGGEPKIMKRNLKLKLWNRQIYYFLSNGLKTLSFSKLKAA